MKLLLIMLLLLLPLVSTAGAYRWLDENGNVHFGSKPKPVKPVAAKQEPILKAIPGKVVKTAPQKSAPLKNAGHAATASNTTSPAKKTATAIPPIKTRTSTDKKSPVAAKPAKPTIKPSRISNHTSKTNLVSPARSGTPKPKAKNQAKSRSRLNADKAKASKPVSTTKPKAQQKAVKKAVTKPAPKAKKKVVKTPAPKPKAAKKKIAKKNTPAPRPEKPQAANSAAQNAELCGLFTNYVSNYENKLVDCDPVSCAIYEKSLKKYQKKKKTYCR